MATFDFSIIKYLRRQKSLSREQLAKQCDVSRQTIANIENGKFIPSMPVIMALTEALGVSYPDLIAYAKRHATQIIKPLHFQLPENKGICQFYKLPEIAVAFLDINDSFSYYLDKCFIQHFFVIDGEAHLDCNSSDCNVLPGRFMSCKGTGGKFVVRNGPARVVVLIVPYDNNVARMVVEPDCFSPEVYFKQALDPNVMLAPCKRRFDFSAIRLLRNSLDYSLEKLANESTVTIATISGIEQNKRCPSLTTLNMLTDCLGVELIEFMEFAFKGGCEICPTRAATMTSVDDQGNPHEMDLLQGRADNLRVGYLTNNSDQELSVPVQNVHVAEKKFIFAIKGHETIYIDDQKYYIPEGQGLFFDGRGKHYYQVGGNHESFAVFSLQKEARHRAFPDEPLDNMLKFGDFDHL